MSHQSERRAEYRRTTGRLRLSEQREGIDPADLSKDFAHLQAKLHTKRAAIRALDAKVKRLEDALRSGLSWEAHQAREAERDRARVEARKAGPVDPGG